LTVEIYRHSNGHGYGGKRQDGSKPPSHCLHATGKPPDNSDCLSDPCGANRPRNPIAVVLVERWPIIIAH